MLWSDLCHVEVFISRKLEINFQLTFQRLFSIYLFKNSTLFARYWKLHWAEVSNALCKDTIRSITLPMKSLNDCRPHGSILHYIRLAVHINCLHKSHWIGCIASKIECKFDQVWICATTLIWTLTERISTKHHAKLNLWKSISDSWCDS